MASAEQIVVFLQQLAERTVQLQEMVARMAVASQGVGTAADVPVGRSRQERVDERFFRKLGVFGGEVWRDWSFRSGHRRRRARQHSGR